VPDGKFPTIWLLDELSVGNVNESTVIVGLLPRFWPVIVRVPWV